MFLLCALHTVECLFRQRLPIPLPSKNRAARQLAAVNGYTCSKHHHALHGPKNRPQTYLLHALTFKLISRLRSSNGRSLLLIRTKRRTCDGVNKGWPPAFFMETSKDPTQIDPERQPPLSVPPAVQICPRKNAPLFLKTETTFFTVYSKGSQKLRERAVTQLTRPPSSLTRMIIVAGTTHAFVPQLLRGTLTFCSLSLSHTHTAGV